MIFVKRQQLSDRTTEEQDPLSQEQVVTGGKCLGCKAKWSPGNGIPGYITGYVSESSCDLYNISGQIRTSPEQLALPLSSRGSPLTVDLNSGL